LLFFRDPPANLLQISGDSQVHFLDLSGDTDYDLRVDWNCQEHYLPCVVPNNTAESLGNLCIYLMSPIVSTSSADPPVYVQIWQAGGDDLTFQRYTSVAVTEFPCYHRLATPTPLLAESQSNVHEDFKAEFPGINPSTYMPERNYITPEFYGSLARLCHRPSDITRGTTSSDETHWVAPNIIPDAATAGVPFAMNDLMLSCFRFWRGETGMVCFAEVGVAVNGVYLPRAQTGNSGSPITTADFYRQCAGTYNGGATKGFTVIVPWYHDAPIVELDEIWLGPSYRPTVSCDGLLNGRRGWFGGEDFCFGTFRPPPLYNPPGPLAKSTLDDLARSEHFGVDLPPNETSTLELSRSQRLSRLAKVLNDATLEARVPISPFEPEFVRLSSLSPVSTKPDVPQIGPSSSTKAPSGALARIFGTSRK